MKTRSINATLLKRAIKERGEGGLADLAQASKVSTSWLQKAMTGNHEAAPRALTCEAICRATGLRLDDLFPLVGAREKKRTG